MTREGSNLNIRARPHKDDGERYAFRNGSEGEPNRHPVATPQGCEVYVTAFKHK